MVKEKMVATADGKDPIQKSLLSISGTSLHRERPLADAQCLSALCNGRATRASLRPRLPPPEHSGQRARLPRTPADQDADGISRRQYFLLLGTPPAFTP